MAHTAEMQAFAARLTSFHTTHHLSKRRASSHGGGGRRKNGNTAEWPHERPAGADLARAGFFYRPTAHSPDNAQCFLCGIQLDGWEHDDDALHEHLSHAPSCAWARSVSAANTSPDTSPDTDAHDPMSDALVAARRGTFEVSEGWVHESKRGWRCKTGPMVDAGWAFDPSPDGPDGVTCFYCGLSLDGWEPKDDPYEEHKRRSPTCVFFALVERLHGADGPAKGKGRKGRGRASTASKASRLSVQSAVSALSDAPSTGTDLVEGAARIDDSITSTGTVASQATVTGKKKGGRKPAAAKGIKGRKGANTAKEEVGGQVHYPDLGKGAPSQEPENVVDSSQADELAPPPRVTKKTARGSKQLDSSVLEASQTDTVPKKATRGRKPKAQLQPEPELPPKLRISDASAQLQEELDHSMDHGIPDHESTPQPAPAAKPKRGVKRTSDGLKREPESSMLDQFPTPPKPAAKSKKGRKPSKQPSVSQEHAPQPTATAIDSRRFEDPWLDGAASLSEADPDKPKKDTKGKKVAVAKKGKGKKASSTRSSRAAANAPAPEPEQAEVEDLARDEAEIEAELARIAAEQQASQQHVQLEQERADEYEPTPSGRAEKHVQEIRELEQELQAEADADAIGEPRQDMSNYVTNVAAQSVSPSPGPKRAVDKENFTPSPTGSDKENQPSSVAQPATVRAAAPVLSPSKAARVPLAPSTPPRLTHSPSKRRPLSPSKHISQLATTHAWAPIDVEAVLLASPQLTPGKLGQRLAHAAGVLTSPEKGLTVEEWVRRRAERGEEELRRRCEELVTRFEAEGVRAMETLNGIVAL